MEKFTRYYCASVLATGNNNGINLDGNSEYVFKSYYKLRHCTKETFKLFFSNSVESTGNCRIGKKGDEYTIEYAKASFSVDKEIEEGEVIITFDKNESKKVSRGEFFSTDEFEFEYRDGGYMVLTFCVKTKERLFIPATNESASTGRIIKNGKEIYSDSFSLRPCFIGVKKDFEKTVAFMGDSITQGSRIPNDSYGAWAHQIGLSLDEKISFWNIGMGWARAYDGSEDGVLVEKAAMCDEVFVCFGVNDLRSGGRSSEQLIADLNKIKENILNRNKNAVVRFLTVPPFNMSSYEEAERKKVNEYIRGTKEYFDIAKCLESDHMGSVREEYMTNKDDAHPNIKGGTAVFGEFLKWKEEKNW